MKARYPGTCPACRDRITVGAGVVNRDGHWLHKRCAAGPVTPVLDRCGAMNLTDGRPCRNPVVRGDLCQVHRWDGRMA